jgi:RHS repeat-associated protein
LILFLTDQKLDKESGLYNYDARLYDPVVGRFVSADSMGPQPYYSQSLNRYAYVYNNPLRYTDPSGHMGDGASLAAAEAGRDIENSDSPGGWTLSNRGDVQMASAGVLSIGAYYGCQLGFFDAFFGTLSSWGRVALTGLSATTATTLAVAGSLVALTPGTLADSSRDIDEDVGEDLNVTPEEGTEESTTTTKEVKERKEPGRDESTSIHIVEKQDDETISVTHQVTNKQGKVKHQHQTHIGKYGTRRDFPDEWTEYQTIDDEK